MLNQENSGSLRVRTQPADGTPLITPRSVDLVPSVEAQNASHFYEQNPESRVLRSTSRPHLITEEFDPCPMPTFEQVAKSMTRALRFQNACPHQEELALQVAEGRKMARSEKNSRSFIEDSSFEYPPARFAPHSPQFPQNLQHPGPNPGAKKRRSRNRNRSGVRTPQFSNQVS